MPWRSTALEDLDDDHATAAAWARVREGRLVAIMMIGIGSLALGLATEQLAGAVRCCRRRRPWRMRLPLIGNSQTGNQPFAIKAF